MRVEQRVRSICPLELGGGDRSGTPPAVGLSSDVQDPARHRDGDTVRGQLAHGRVEPFPGRFACDRYAVARRRTSFSCSSCLIRLRASRSSAESFLLTPGLVHSSVSPGAAT